MSKKSFYDVLWLLCQEEGHVDKWIEEGLIGKTKNSFYFTPKAKELLKINEVVGKKVEVEDFSWVAAYNELFDKKNIGTSGNKTELGAVMGKMAQFCKKYDYTPEEILEATTVYIGYAIDNHGAERVQESHYFISKKMDGVDISNLAKWCEEMRTNGQKYTSRRTI